MIEFNGETEEEVRTKVHALHRELAKHYASALRDQRLRRRPDRRQIRKILADAPLQLPAAAQQSQRQTHRALHRRFRVVPPPHLTAFLPQLRKIIKKYKLFATIAGHMGDGNFHVIPLMKLEDPNDRKKILPAMKAVNNLVLKYGGSLSGEHNDGLVRGPWLKMMYGAEVLHLFQEAKHIMDPEDIFNPHKKATANWEYSFSHIRDHF